MTPPLLSAPPPSEHDPHFTYHRFRKGGMWRCSCGANGETTRSPVVGWADHVAAVTRNNIEGDV